MDFVFMLTRADRTIGNGLEVLAEIRSLGIRHIGCKDIGVDVPALAELHRAIAARGATSYLEVVDTDDDACLHAARIARELGFDYLLGGTRVPEVLELLAGSTVRYLPYPGRPFDHPTRLGGSPAAVADDCRRCAALGAAGVDLLAYRATEADPLDLVRAARAATDGRLLVAGGVCTPAQIRALADAGVDAFTVGTAVFEGSFAPHTTSLCAQLQAVLDACA